MFTRERFLIPLYWMFCSALQPMWDLTAIRKGTRALLTVIILSLSETTQWEGKESGNKEETRVIFIIIISNFDWKEKKVKERKKERKGGRLWRKVKIHIPMRDNFEALQHFPFYVTPFDGCYSFWLHHSLIPSFATSYD